MGCGASSARIVDRGGNIVSIPLLEKLVLGVTSAEVLLGTPVHAQAHDNPKGHAEGIHESFGFTVAESNRKAKIVQGLADAASAVSASNIVAAAGLAMAAAEVAETMAMTAGVVGADLNQSLPSRQLASAALEAARAGSETAIGLTERAIHTAVIVAQARRRNNAVAVAAVALAEESASLVLPGIAGDAPARKKGAKYSEILDDLFKNCDF